MPVQILIVQDHIAKRLHEIKQTRFPDADYDDKDYSLIINMLLLEHDTIQKIKEQTVRY